MHETNRGQALVEEDACVESFGAFEGGVEVDKLLVVVAALG